VNKSFGAQPLALILCQYVADIAWETAEQFLQKKNESGYDMKVIPCVSSCLYWVNNDYVVSVIPNEFTLQTL
jgi:hypothetical protein